MPSPDIVYGALPPPACEPTGLGEALPAQSRPSPFRPAAPKAGPPGEQGAQALGGGSGGSGGLCSAVGVTLDLRLHQMTWPPASSGGPLLPRPGAPSLLAEPSRQQDTTPPVPGSRREEARPAWRPGRDPRGTEQLGEWGGGVEGLPGQGGLAVDIGLPFTLSPRREASMVACRVPAPPPPPEPRSGASPSSLQAPQVCTCTGFEGVFPHSPAHQN